MCPRPSGSDQSARSYSNGANGSYHMACPVQAASDAQLPPLPPNGGASAPQHPANMQPHHHHSQVFGQRTHESIGDYELPAPVKVEAPRVIPSISAPWSAGRGRGAPGRGRGAASGQPGRGSVVSGLPGKAIYQNQTAVDMQGLSDALPQSIPGKDGADGDDDMNYYVNQRVVEAVQAKEQAKRSGSAINRSYQGPPTAIGDGGGSLGSLAKPGVDTPWKAINPGDDGHDYQNQVTDYCTGVIKAAIIGAHRR